MPLLDPPMENPYEGLGEDDAQGDDGELGDEPPKVDQEDVERIFEELTSGAGTMPSDDIPP